MKTAHTNPPKVMIISSGFESFDFWMKLTEKKKMRLALDSFELRMALNLDVSILN